MSDNIRQAYFGYDPDVFKLGLDNGFNFMIEGGRVGVGTATPIGTLDVKAHEVSVANTESPIFNLLSRPSTGTTDNLFQFNQGVGAGTGETFAVLRMGNHYTNYGVPDEIVLRANGDSFFNSGNVGVGTNTPVEQFQIGDRWTFHDGGHKIIGYNFRFDGGPKRILEDEASALRFTESGEIRFDVGGSGSSGSTINFTTALTINNDGAITWGNGGILKATNGSSIELGGARTPYLDFRNDNNTDYDARFILYDDNTLVLAGTNLLMGKTSQANTSYKIDVAGKIRGNEIVVNTDGADYVFDPSYRLTPLDTLEAYVREHRHLPGIAPAREMQHEGMAVGETTTKLLEKIEELTLYVIELKNENAVQESRMEKAAETHSAVLERIERLTLLVEAQQKQIERLKKENQ